MDGRYCGLWSPGPRRAPSATNSSPPFSHRNPQPAQFPAIDRAWCRAAVGRSGTAASIVLLAPVLKHGTEPAIASILPCLVTLLPPHGDSKTSGAGLMMLRPTHVRRPP